MRVAVSRGGGGIRWGFLRKKCGSRILCVISDIIRVLFFVFRLLAFVFAASPAVWEGAQEARVVLHPPPARFPCFSRHGTINQ